MQNLFDTAECRESAKRATAVRLLDHVNPRKPARVPRRSSCACRAQDRSGRDAPPGGPPAPRSADVAHAPPSAEPSGSGKTPSSDRPAGQCPKTRRGPQRDPPCGACSPHDAGRGPYAPQRRSGRPRSRCLPQDAKEARRGYPPAGLSRRYRKAPSASATPCPPAALRCSTLGEGGLNCRVRDGTG